MSDSIEDVIAWHEAAHGRVAEMVGGWPVTGMEVNGDDESGVTYIDIPAAGLHELNDQELDAYMAVCAAGQAGAAYCYTEAGYTYEEAFELAEEGTGSDRDDFYEAAEFHGSDAEWDHYVNDAYRFVADNQAVIAADVAALEENDYRLDELQLHEPDEGCCHDC